MKSFAYSYLWEGKCVAALEKDDYVEHVNELKQVGCILRKEVYAKETLVINKKEYVVRLKSYGSQIKNKAFLGINPLAYAFDKLLFDYVYAFLEEKKQARTNM